MGNHMTGIRSRTKGAAWATHWALSNALGDHRTWTVWRFIRITFPVTTDSLSHDSLTHYHMDFINTVGHLHKSFRLF